MKKIVFVCLILSTMFLCSCFANFSFSFFNEDNYAMSITNDIFNAITTRDENKILEIFASNSVRDREKFLKSVNSLFDYCNVGEISSIKFGSLRSEGSKIDSENGIVCLFSKDIFTTVDSFRICVKATYLDSSDVGNIGVNSFYIIKYSDDSDTSTAYDGDGKYTNGINIGIKSIDNPIITSTVKDIINAIKEKDANKMMDLFAKSSIKEDEFEAAFAYLTEYCVAEDLISVEMMKVMGNIKDNKEENYGKFFFSYDFTTSDQKYRICGKITVMDFENKDNMGINSVYLINYEEDTDDSAYFGDEKFTAGIHISVKRP